jgi:hypothetical protein
MRCAENLEGNSLDSGWSGVVIEIAKKVFDLKPDDHWPFLHAMHYN